MTNYNLDAKVTITIPSWVFTYIWGLPFIDANLWKGTHEHDITFTLRIGHYHSCLQHVEMKLRRDVEHLWDYPEGPVDTARAFMLLYTCTVRHDPEGTNDAEQA